MDSIIAEILSHEVRPSRQNRMNVVRQPKSISIVSTFWNLEGYLIVIDYWNASFDLIDDANRFQNVVRLPSCLLLRRALEPRRRLKLK